MIYMNVSKKINSPSALTQEQGDVIYADIMQAFKRNEEVTLDFSDIESMISPFLNHAIGKLYENYDSDYIKHALHMNNFPPEKISTLNIVISNAKKYYSHRDIYEQTVKEVIDNA